MKTNVIHKCEKMNFLFCFLVLMGLNLHSHKHQSNHYKHLQLRKGNLLSFESLPSRHGKLSDLCSLFYPCK